MIKNINKKQKYRWKGRTKEGHKEREHTRQKME